jgi:hypothetical protein
MTLKKFSKPLLLGRSHWYVMGRDEDGGLATIDESTLSDAAIW